MWNLFFKQKKKVVNDDEKIKENYKKYINDVDNIKALNEYWNTNKLILIDYYKN